MLPLLSVSGMGLDAHPAKHFVPLSDCEQSIQNCDVRCDTASLDHAIVNCWHAMLMPESRRQSRGSSVRKLKAYSTVSNPWRLGLQLHMPRPARH